MAQLVVHIQYELKDNGIISSLADSLIAGDANLEIELQVALSEKSRSYRCDVPPAIQTSGSRRAGARRVFTYEADVPASGLVISCLLLLCFSFN